MLDTENVRMLCKSQLEFIGKFFNRRLTSIKKGSFWGSHSVQSLYDLQYGPSDNFSGSLGFLQYYRMMHKRNETFWRPTFGVKIELSKGSWPILANRSCHFFRLNFSGHNCIVQHGEWHIGEWFVGLIKLAPLEKHLGKCSPCATVRVCLGDTAKLETWYLPDILFPIIPIWPADQDQTQ